MTEEVTPRKIMFVLEDDGNELFTFRLEGDTQRLGMPSIPRSHYSAAEHWATELFMTFQEMLKNSMTVKKLNREEKRAQK